MKMNDNLKSWADKYETAAFIENDPVQIPHRYKSANVPVEFYGESIRPDIAEKVNIEISAFFTAWVCFGNRKSIIAKADFIDRILFEGNPFNYIVGETWRQYAGSSENFYRFFTFGDFHNLCERYNKILVSWLTLEDAINDQDKTTSLAALQSLFGSVEGIPDETSESACKRLCLFLRWMCRKNSPVDFGLWTLCDPKNLIIPLDTHVHKLALKLGLTKRKSTDIITAIEITDRLAQVFPEDPSRGDFSLFGYEMDPEAPAKPKGLQTVSDMSIADVLKTQTFFDQTAADLTQIWNDRETARIDAEKDKTRLKVHPLDYLYKAGLMEPGQFIVAYAKIVDRVMVDLPANQRLCIQTIGDSAFHKTMKILIDLEAKGAKDAKKRNSRKRKSN